jgi:hypothetical protein
MESPLEIAASVVHKAGIIQDVEPEELVEIMQHAEIAPKDMDKLAGTVVYIRKRFIENNSRYAAFKVAFPDRCIPQEDANVPFPNTTGEVSRTAIEIKAKRLEQSQIYKKVVALLQTNLYISYAMQRMQILDESFKNSFDDDVAHRDRVAYMKLFMESTAKPEEVKGMEVNVNFGDGTTTLKSVEEKLGDISKKLEGKSAEEIIDVLAIPQEAENGDNSTSSVQ